MCVRESKLPAKPKKADKWEILITLGLLSTHPSYETYRAEMKKYRAERVPAAANV